MESNNSKEEEGMDWSVSEPAAARFCAVLFAMLKNVSKD
jgi:hypothetical protein